MTKKTITVHIEVNDITIEWAKKSYPHLDVDNFSKKRNIYLLLSRALLSKILEDFFYINELPKIDYLEHGKPYFPYIKNLFFNISHTEKHIAIIVSNEGLVGIDIESIKKRKNFTGLEDRVMNLLEKNWLHEQQNYLESFFILWSAKEAYLKAMGTGLGGLSSLQLDMKNDKANGPLKNGYLHLSTHNSNSFAIYLATKNKCTNYLFDTSIYHKQKIQWKVLTCSHSSVAI